MSNLVDEKKIEIRYSDTDAMGVVWHGNYLRYFEDGRESFGKKYGMEYLNVYRSGYFTPIVKSEINHKSSIKYGEEAKVITRLIYSPAAKIIFDYEIHNLTTGKVSATGQTIQAFIDSETEVLELNKPDFYLSWEEKAGLKPQTS